MKTAVVAIIALLAGIAIGAGLGYSLAGGFGESSASPDVTTSGSGLDTTGGANPDARKVAVPDLKGLDLDKAAADVARASLCLGVVRPQPGSTNAAPTVVDQRPVSGTQVREFSDVNVLISGQGQAPANQSPECSSKAAQSPA